MYMQLCTQLITKSLCVSTSVTWDNSAPDSQDINIKAGVDCGTTFHKETA